MSRLTFSRRSVLAVAGGLLFSPSAVSHAAAAQIKVLTSVALAAALNEIAPKYEEASGNKLDIGYSLIADIRKRMLAGETADVIVLSRPVMDELQKQDKFAPNSVIDVAGTPVALAIRAGAPKPDISTAEALKTTLLNAKSIAYADPAKGGAQRRVFRARHRPAWDRRSIEVQNDPGVRRTVRRNGRQRRSRDRRRPEFRDRAGRGRASARPFARRVRQHDSFHGRHRCFEQEPGCSQIAHPISHRTGREARSQRERLPARMTSDRRAFRAEN
jgi:hypothetical protein